MDGELWTSRMSTSKRHHSLQPSQSAFLAFTDPQINLDDVDGDEEVRTQFLCPYCYGEFDVTALCSHLEDEHCFEFKAVTCPVCAAKIAKDMVAHISLQHGHLFKMHRRRRFRRAGAPSSATLSLLGKELREAHLQAILGGTSRIGALPANASDPLLSTVVYNVPIDILEEPPKPGAIVEESPSKSSLSSQQLKPRCLSLRGGSDARPLSNPSPSVEASLTVEEREQRLKEAELRAKFVQQLLLSTLLGDK